jgi:DNA-binding beta-propeller fold protein YncE
VGADDIVYVTDIAMDRIYKFSPDGTLLCSWGGSGEEAGRFTGPMGIDVGPGGLLFVADSHNHRVQIFDALTPVQPVSWGRIKSLYRE